MLNGEKWGNFYSINSKQHSENVYFQPVKTHKTVFLYADNEFVIKYFAKQKKHRIFASPKIVWATNINFNQSGGLYNS
jgi:hypothetical protein